MGLANSKGELTSFPEQKRFVNGHGERSVQMGLLDNDINLVLESKSRSMRL